LAYLIHELSHQINTDITVLTRETGVTLPNGHSHGSHESNDNGKLSDAHQTVQHTYHNQITHIKTAFCDTELKNAFEDKDVIICCLSGSDLHLSAALINNAKHAGIKMFIPSEYGLDTSNPNIRSLLPPYQIRFEIQEKLRKSGLSWKAIYSGIILEDALKTDGVLGIDVMWASTVVFPDSEKTKLAISTLADIAKNVVDFLNLDDKDTEMEVYNASFTSTIGEIVGIIEEELDRDLDRYEGSLEGAKKEAEERMKMGFFDGGVALMGRVAVWESNVDAWASWKNIQGNKQIDRQEEVKRIVRMVRGGHIGGGGCGC
jgi:hypothetical protein